MWASGFRYRIMHLIIRSREDSKTQYRYLEFSSHLLIWEVSLQHQCELNHCTKLHRLEASQVMLNLRISHFIGYGNGPWLQYFYRIRNWIKIWTALVQDMRSQSQRKLAHVRTMYQISLRSAEHVINKSITNFYWISYSIEISLIGWAADPAFYLFTAKAIASERISCKCIGWMFRQIML